MKYIAFVTAAPAGAAAAPGRRTILTKPFTRVL